MNLNFNRDLSARTDSRPVLVCKVPWELSVCFLGDIFFIQYLGQLKIERESRPVLVSLEKTRIFGEIQGTGKESTY